MSLLLNVPYEEKDEAKALGARWNPKLKKWYVEAKKDYPKFIKWILGEKEQVYILCDYFYIVEGVQICFRCHNATKVIGYGIHRFYDICNPDIYETDKTWSYSDDEIHIASHIDPLPEQLLEHLKQKYGYYESYSQTMQASYLANHCSHCQVIQGDFYLFGEVDSPFFLATERGARNLKLYKVPLAYDLIVDADVSWSSGDWMLKEYSNIVDFSFRC